MSKKRKQTDRTITLSVSYNELRLAILSKNADTSRVKTKSIVWRENARTLHSEDGQRELSVALTQLLEGENLAGNVVHIALSSDYCVTRVASGDNELVDTELRGLADRSALYLSLGTGRNAMSESRRPIDARSQQAWLTVTNQRSLEAVIRIVEDAGLTVRRVEHSVMALCRAVGCLGLDSEDPVLIIEINHRGVELAISYQGLLLLDYRPGGRDSQDHIAQTVQTHLKRLHRYCDRHFRFRKQHTLRTAVLFGSDEEVKAVRAQFADGTDLEPVLIRPDAVRTDWDFSESSSFDTLSITAIGTMLAAIDPDTSHAPNMMDHIDAFDREPLLPSVLRAAWPIGAAALVTLGILAATWYEGTRCGTLEQQSSALGSSKMRVVRLRKEMSDTQHRLEQLSHIDQQTSNPPWHRIIGHVGACLPEGCWLEKLAVRSQGQVTISGASHEEDSVFEFVRYLKLVPSLRNVALEGTQPVRREDGPATRFDVSCQLSELADIAKE